MSKRSSKMDEAQIESTSILSNFLFAGILATIVLLAAVGFILIK